MIKRALISVSDKTGIVEFAKKLEELGVEILSTGGTAKLLKESGVSVIPVSDVTGFPEILDGRVKTLHPKIHGGILAVRENKEHMNQLNELNIKPIDLLVINLYPFKETIKKEGITFEEAIENIDIGGPTMIRAAAKNHQDVAVVINPERYSSILEEIEQTGDISLKTKRELALEVFSYTAHYDALIADYLRKQLGRCEFPELFTITFEKQQELRYGENPHQKACFYREVIKPRGSLVRAEQLHGKELSFNNINDANAAVELVKEFTQPTVVGLKHTNPCGVGSGETVYEAYKKAFEADPVSIFGGIFAFNRPVDKKTAEEINKIFIEIVVAPDFEPEALEVLKQKKNIRLLRLEDLQYSTREQETLDMKRVAGGLLVQEADVVDLDKEKLKVVTEKEPDEREWQDLFFGWKVVKHVKSNGIVLVKNLQTVGVGPGQVNRIWPTKYSILQAGEKARGAVLASDAFFPFADVVEAAAEAGITAIIQPGGSIRDKESIEAANAAGIAMVFTGIRHFKH
ncbi:MAG: phosphoribosylaminoimidazolecarboxamide formyltransferase / cyclohydrolase [Thermosediminibacterales bacterium]|nr:phosphoribosylaminoimidazolecarboxamide formyltransferase / cyclohydrolase [Thermosediminibacterales bacterium]MDK2835318.1 phosphoribosylaminoimidazolecarboxamide formyltransferase / cyclohydrolase [Thermosediminibacterales bacterium]